MKLYLLGISIAACVAACSSGEFDASAVREADGLPPVLLASTARTTTVTATNPTLVSKGIQPKLLEGEGVVSRIVQQGEYWNLCANGPNLPDTCLPIVPTYIMAGIEVQVILANDGTTPLVTFKPASNTTRTPYDQARAVDLFMHRLGEAVNRITNRTKPGSAGCLRASREGGSSKQRQADDCNNVSGDGEDDPPDCNPSLTAGNPVRSHGCSPASDGDGDGSGGSGDIPVVEVPGQRETPDGGYMPLPLPPDPIPEDGGAGGGGGGGEGEGVSPNDATPLKSSCVFLPPPVGIWACTVPVPGKRPDPVNLPPPPPNWCQLTGLGCTNDNQPPNLNPLRDMCNSRYVVEAAQCIEERVKGHTDREHELLCMDKAQAKLAWCVSKSPLRAPVLR
jgi:hypothetical protein